MVKSKKPKKQRKSLFQAALHFRRKFMAAHLSKELREKYKTRSFPVRKGDEVEVTRGKFVKKRGKISKVDPKNYKIYIEGISIKRTDGTERLRPIHPSNLKILNLNLTDKKRVKALGRKGGKTVKKG
jgi:large subunit ribosomal protein L24